MTSTAREQFLDRLRGRLEDGVPSNPLRPLLPLEGDVVPPVRYSTDLSDPATCFTEAAAAAGATVRRLPDADVSALVAEVCRRTGARTAVVSRDPECAAVPAALEALGVEEVPAGDPQMAARADLGITGAVAGIGLTGTLVLDARRAGGRTASLLPPVHLALVPEDAIVPTAGHVLRAWSGEVPTDLSSNIVFVTGPSRSADIELQLTVGVHGPRELWIGILGTGVRGAATTNAGGDEA